VLVYAVRCVISQSLLARGPAVQHLVDVFGVCFVLLLIISCPSATHDALMYRPYPKYQRTNFTADTGTLGTISTKWLSSAAA